MFFKKLDTQLQPPSSEELKFPPFLEELPPKIIPYVNKEWNKAK